MVLIVLGVASCALTQPGSLASDCYYNANERLYDKAISACHLALSFNPTATKHQVFEAAVIHITLGGVYQNTHDFAAAVQEYRQALALYAGQPGIPDILVSLPHQALGNTLKAKGDYDSAIQEYRQAISLNPQNEIMHRQLAEALKASGDLDAATREFKLADAMHQARPVISRSVADQSKAYCLVRSNGGVSFRGQNGTQGSVTGMTIQGCGMSIDACNVALQDKRASDPMPKAWTCTNHVPGVDTSS
jgi:tetratricopeptide (TPR) repeat protein